MPVRRAVSEDVHQILNLFYETIQKVNSEDYSEAQIRVWSEARDEETWKKKIQDQYFLVKEVDHEILGFSSIDETGYLDFLYVHAAHQGKGIASALLREISKKAADQGNRTVWTSSSITAQPFFRKHGFVETKKETKFVKGVEFVNSIMTLNL